MSNNGRNKRITVSPEIPALFLSSLELNILNCYGYEVEDDGYGSYQLSNDHGGASTLKVSVEDLSNGETESAAKLQAIVNGKSIKAGNGFYCINLGELSDDLFSAEILFQCLLKKPEANTLLGDEILLKSDDWIARITPTSIQQASLSNLLYQWRKPCCEKIHRTNQNNAIKTALLSDVQHALTKPLDEIREIVMIHLNDQGDTCADCQRVCLLNALSSLEALVTGISVNDLSYFYHAKRALP